LLTILSFLYNGIVLFNLADGDPQACPHHVKQRAAVRETKDKRTRVEKVCITGPRANPEVVEKREEQESM
jgi:hypothetical protein